MAATPWSWEKTPYGWWFGRSEGFRGEMTVFERQESRWCAKVEMRWKGMTDLVHFSEGHLDDSAAKMAAEKAAADALRIRSEYSRVTFG